MSQISNNKISDLRLKICGESKIKAFFLVQGSTVEIMMGCSFLCVLTLAMTGYSPSVLALNDMLRQQLQLTENYISVQKTMYQSLLNSTQPDYVYTTLEDTKRVGSVCTPHWRTPYR